MFQRNQFKNKKQKTIDGPVDLQRRITLSGGQTGLALEGDPIQGRNINSFSSQRSDRGSFGLYRQINETNSSVIYKNRTFRKSSEQRTLNNAKSALSVAGATLSSRQSRFSSGRSKPATILNTNTAVHIVCAISENLARETCISSLDAGSPTSLQVTKQGNGQTYAETLAYLEILKPDEILLNEGRSNSQLARKVQELFISNANEKDVHEKDGYNPNCDLDEDEANSAHITEARYGTMVNTAVVKFISRSLFDQTKGAELLKRITREDTYDASILEEYIFLSSAHAVLQYTQMNLGATFTRKSLYLSINSGGKNRMAIDRSTLLQLELLVNSKTGKVRHSLIGTIDRTKTGVGSRLLRTNLMSPPMRADTINTRLELVDLFLGNEDFFYAVLEHLNSIPDIDRMLSNIALVPRKKQNSEGNLYVNERMASKGISALVCIKTTLQALPSFASVLQSQLQSMTENERSSTTGTRLDDHATIVTDRSSLLVGLGGGHASSVCRNHLLRAITFSMNQPDLQIVLDAIVDVFTETTTFTRNANAMRHQECFALRCEENGMMSIIRKAFLANVDDIYKKADEYAEIHGFHVAVRYSSARGYYIAVPEDVGTGLPQVFLQPTRSGRFLNCTTEEIASLNTRAQDNVHDLLLMTHDRIQEVLDIARERYDAVASLCDAVALLDMCHSFADNVTLNTLPWCRPVITDHSKHDRERRTISTAQSSDDEEPKAAMMIRNGRYAINIESCSSDGPNGNIPNDTYAADGKNFTVVTGINGSGKTTYLKQIAIITILAHCGSYVPAEAASVPIRDRLCCRIGNSDDQEHNISTFMSEMKETAFICNHASDKSLILMDELGRATNNEDGVAIAWSVSEYLIKTGAMTFFVTHYPQLSQLANIYPTVQNVCLEAEIKKGEISEILYTHKVRAGSCSVSTSYGVEMAAACGWSAEVVNDARDVENEVSKLLPYDGLCHPELTEQNNSRNRAFELLGDTLKKLRTLVNADRAQSYDSVRAELSAIQRQLLDTTDADISTAIDQLLQTGATTVDARKNSSMKSRIQPGSIRNIDNTYNGQKVETEADNREKFSEFEVDNNQSESDRSDGESTISSSTVSSDETSSDDTFRSHNYAKLK